jgi:WD40 repeat protein
MLFAKDGRELITGGYHELLVWDPETGDLLRRITNNGQRTYGLALSPDGSLLAAATGSPGEAGEVRVFHIDSGEVVATPFRSDAIALCVAFDPSGKHLALGGADGRLRLVDTRTWKDEFTLSAHSDWINALAWNEDGSRLATASRDKTAKVFDPTGSGKRIVTFSGHSEVVRGIAFHPAGTEMLSCADDGLVLRWKIEEGKKSGDLAQLDGQVLRLVESEADYFAAGPEGLAVQFQRPDQKRLRDFQIDPAGTLAAGAVHDAHLALGTLDGRVVLFDLDSEEPARAFLAAPK